MNGKLNRWTHRFGGWTHGAKIIGATYVDGVKVSKGQGAIIRCSIRHAATAEEIKALYDEQISQIRVN